jgi:hypothetical protein
MAVMTKTSELLETIKNYYCLAGVYLDLVIYKVKNNQVAIDDSDYLSIENKIHELKAMLRETVVNITPHPSDVKNYSNLAEYLDLLTIKEMAEALDLYLDAIIFNISEITAGGLC